MKAKVIIELSESFVEAIKNEMSITTADELKELLKGSCMEGLNQVLAAVVDIKVEVEE